MLPLLLACKAPDPERAPPAGPLVAFDLTDGAALFDAPFPSAHRLRDGRVDVADWPNPGRLPFVDALLGMAAEATGFGTTSGVVFRLEDPDTALLPVDPARSLDPDAPAFLVALDGPAEGRRIPLDLWVQADGGPFGAPGLVTLLPLQGVPLDPDTTWAAVLRRSLGAEGPLGVPPALWALGAGEVPAGWSAEVAEAYAGALAALPDPDEVAALAVFRTWDPTAELRDRAALARAAPPPVPTPLVLTEVHDTFCVLEGTVDMPVWQDPNGAWQPDPQGVATSRLWVTVPRSAARPAGYPVTVMVRTGGGGDRPLIDRGLRGEPGGPALLPGTGPAQELARAGHVGVQVDGPHGGPWRNPSGADEQFLMFDVGDPVATRDNVRQSALELALVPGILADLPLDATGCPEATPDVPLDLDHVALLGHSMGATIAPLVLASAPEYRAVVLSGAGGSYLYNLVYKQSPLEVRPIAEALLGYTARGRTLREDDPVLQLVQWVSEPADPPPYAAASAAEVLMVQGMVDTYILPPMANAVSLAYGLDQAGPALDGGHPELEGMRPLGEVLPFGGGEAVDLPVSGPPVRVVVQVAEDGIEDGHEVLFQTGSAKHQYRCFLGGFADDAPVVPVAGAETEPCPDAAR